MWHWLRGAAVAAALLTAGPVAALTIITNYVPPGGSIPSIGMSTAPPESAVGEGDLRSIVRAAADAWQSLIADPHTLTLTFGWHPTTGISNSAFHIGTASVGSPEREIAGSIAFNSGETFFPAYLDPTPGVNDEFVFERRHFDDAGSGPIETGRTFRATTSEAQQKNDIYTAALHEIGHALGLTKIDGFESDALDGDIDISIPGFAGSQLPVIGTHLLFDESLLSYKPRDVGQRRGVSQADLLAVCQASGFRSCQTDLAAADYAGDINNDGIVNAADFTIWRDRLDDGTPESTTVYETWANQYGTTFTTQATLQGDYNHDGLIDAADYTVWRDAISPTDLRADADTDGSITAADLNVWAENYGAETAPGGSAVPEPAAAVLLLLITGSLALQRSIPYCSTLR